MFRDTSFSQYRDTDNEVREETEIVFVDDKSVNPEMGMDLELSTTEPLIDNSQAIICMPTPLDMTPAPLLFRAKDNNSGPRSLSLLSLPNSSTADIDSLTNQLGGLVFEEIGKKITHSDIYTSIVKSVDGEKTPIFSEFVKALEEETAQIARSISNDIKDNDLDELLDAFNSLSVTNQDSLDKLEAKTNLIFYYYAYKLCLQLDVKKWQLELEGSGKEIKHDYMPKEFIAQEDRCFPRYVSRVANPNVTSKINMISNAQLCFNYWRSFYHHAREIEKTMGKMPYELEREIWDLEQRTLYYKNQTTPFSKILDINNSRLNEPEGIDPTTGLRASDMPRTDESMMLEDGASARDKSITFGRPR